MAEIITRRHASRLGDYIADNVQGDALGEECCVAVGLAYALASGGVTVDSATLAATEDVAVRAYGILERAAEIFTQPTNQPVAPAGGQRRDDE